MTYKALYRMYRPHIFEDVVGQQHIVVTLKNAIKTNRLSHAYLFSGPRGTGKTTVAKILAKAVNCLSKTDKPCEKCDACRSISVGNHPDIIEIDAASNNGVDEIRDLIDKVKYAPLELHQKVYIIDEVHMLTTGAFNALLKTLEEPPAHVMFVLATTEPHKVIPTIISRCQRFDFTKVSMVEIQNRLEGILAEEAISVETGVTKLIAQLADGGLRDALSILEQVIAYSGDNVTKIDVYKVYGLTTTEEKLELLKIISQKNVREILKFLKEITIKSHDIKKLTIDLIECLKEGLIYHYTQSSDNLAVLSVEETILVNTFLSVDESIEFIDLLMETLEKYRNATNSLTYFEVALLKMVHHLENAQMDAMRKFNQESYKVVDISAKSTPFIKNESSFEIEKAIDEDILIEKDFNDDFINTKENIIQRTKIISEEEYEAENENYTDKPLLQVEHDNLFDLYSPQVSERVSVNNLLLGLMQTANKESRFNDEKNWKMKPYLHHLEYAKVARLLRNSIVKLSADTFIVIEVDVEEEKYMIMDPKLEHLVRKFVFEILNAHKKLFCVTKFEWSVALNTYLELKDTPSLLPKPVKIVVDDIDTLDENVRIKNNIQAVVGHHVDVVIED